MSSTMFAELLAHPDVEERLALRSKVGFLAFHGGSLEKQTDVIATAAAQAAGASLYAVIQPPSLQWHVPSRLVSPDASPALATFLDHVDVAIAIHGFGRAEMFTTLLAGGSNRELARHVAACIRVRLYDYVVVDELDDIPEELRGLHPQNPVNRPSLGGVQLELPPRVRGLGPFWAGHDPDAAVQHTAVLIDSLCHAARTWPPTPPVTCTD